MTVAWAEHIGIYERNGVTGADVQEALEVLVGGMGVTEHGALTGLADDDHSQYHNDARGDARYSVLAHTHVYTSRRTLGMVFDGGGATPTPGSVSYIVAQFAGTIDRWDITADVAGSAVVDVWKAAGAIPTDANRIAGTEKLTLTAAQLASDTSITTWTTLAVAVGDVLGFELESVTTCTRVTAQVRIAETI